MKIESSMIDWQKVNGIVPCIVQDFISGRVLMLGYMNEEALEKTQEKNKLTFWSRTKNALWCKGETSGNFLNLKSLTLDCDNDTLLALVEPQGPTCHLGTKTCFAGDEGPKASVLIELMELIHQRKVDMPDGSYTTSLFKKGVNKIAQKVGEEGVETVIAALAESDERLISESADLLYHLLVLLEGRGTRFTSVIDELKKRNS